YVARSRAARECAAVNPYHHRPSISWFGSGPHVEKEAVLALLLQWSHVDGTCRILSLRTFGSVLRPVADASPPNDRLRRLPPEIADRRRGVGNAFEDAYTMGRRTGNDASFDVDGRVVNGGIAREDQPAAGDSEPHRNESVPNAALKRFHDLLQRPAR